MNPISFFLVSTVPSGLGEIRRGGQHTCVESIAVGAAVIAGDGPDQLGKSSLIAQLLALADNTWHDEQKSKGMDTIPRLRNEGKQRNPNRGRKQKEEKGEGGLSRSGTPEMGGEQTNKMQAQSPRPTSRGDRSRRACLLSRVGEALTAAAG